MKTLTTDRSRAPRQDQVYSPVPQTWEDFSRLYPIYEALTRQRDLPGGPYPSGTKSGAWSDKRIRERDLAWLDQVDEHLQAVHLRHFLVTPAVAREDSLRLFLQRHLSKPEKLPSDRDKVDLLLVQYFVLCAPHDMISGSIEVPDVAKILEPVLGEVKAECPDSCEPLNRILETARQCRRLREFMENGLLDQGRLVKGTVEESFYEPAVLVSICRFNFLLRRTFIQWLHADLRAIGVALNQLEKQGFQVVDCRRAGLSSQEPISNLRHFHEHWKPPFQNDYSQNSAYQPYEQLMCLREDLEDALGITDASTGLTPALTVKKENHRGEPADAGPSQTVPPGAPSAAPLAPPPSGKPQDSAAPEPRPNSGATAAGQSQDRALPNIGVADVENLEEKIWEQLIATPPVRGRSMTTVTVENTRILLSAWEVAAFISDSGQDSEELRRLIVARALLSTSIERRKRLMDFNVLRQATAHARAEIPRFQERVDQLKRTMKTDGAVNLGISLKRLLSLAEEAEQLQKANEPNQEKR